MSHPSPFWKRFHSVRSRYLELIKLLDETQAREVTVCLTERLSEADHPHLTYHSQDTFLQKAKTNSQGKIQRCNQA